MCFYKKLNKLEKWILPRILKKICRQDWNHLQAIAELYSAIEKAVRDEFYEDNILTLDTVIDECFLRGRIGAEPCTTCINRALSFDACDKCLQRDRKFWNELKIDFTEEEEKVII